VAASHAEWETRAMPRLNDEHPQYTLVELDGEIDLHSSPAARTLVLTALQRGRPVLVDLSAVSYIDSSGVANLVEGYQLARHQGLAFALIGVSDAAENVLKLARLDQVFPIFASTDAWQDAQATAGP
jgi:anti-sigma B factor antagonist